MSAENASRLSVHLMPTAPIPQVVELARAAEDAGARRCWVNDEGLHTRDPYVTLTAVAAATERLLLGPGIINPYVRHPGATVAAIASLDEFSDGRAFLGLGAGGGLTLGPFALDRPAPVATVAEMIDTTRRLLSGRVVDHEGPVFGYRQARLSYGRPDLEILLAGRGPRMTELAARAADGYNLAYVHKDSIGDLVGTLRSVGRPLVLTYTTMLVSDDAEMASARAGLTFRLVDSPASVRERIGIDDQRVGQLREALAAGGPAAAADLIEERWVEAFMIVGDDAAAATELRGLLATHGIDEFQLPIPDIAVGRSLLDRVAPWLA